MLLSGFAEVQLSSSNTKYFEELGYKIPRIKNNRNKMVTPFGTKIKVRVKDLLSGSNALVEVECDICKEIKRMKYEEYTRTLNSKDNFLNIYVCNACRNSEQHIEKIIQFKCDNNLFNKKDKYYYRVKKHRLIEIQNWIDKYGNIDNMNKSKEGANLSAIIRRYGDTPRKLAEELKYNVFDISTRKENGYFSNFEIVKNRIEEFISIKNYFPSRDEMVEYGINNHAIAYHGGIQGIKEKMNYNKKYDLKDNSGFYNRSRFEMWTANFLIAYNIPYNRETYPFKNSKIRSDFEIQIINSNGEIESVFIEVWGLNSDDYLKKREKKKNLYKKNKYKLIEIEIDDFKDQTFQQIQKNLYNKFKDILNLKYINLKNEVIFPYYMSDKEIIEEIMKFSKEEFKFPNLRWLSLNHKKLYQEVINRYGNFEVFGEKYGISPKQHRNNYWTKEIIFEKFQYFIQEYGKIPSIKIINNLTKDNKDLIGLGARLSKDSFTDLKIEFLTRHINEDMYFTDDIIKWIRNIANSKQKNTSTNPKYTEKQKLECQQILDKQLNKIIHIKESKRICHHFLIM